MSLEENTGSGNGVQPTARRTRKAMSIGSPESGIPRPVRGRTSHDEVKFHMAVKALMPGQSLKLDNVALKTAKDRVEKLDNGQEYDIGYADFAPYGKHLRIWRLTEEEMAAEQPQAA